MRAAANSYCKFRERIIQRLTVRCFLVQHSAWWVSLEREICWDQGIGFTVSTAQALSSVRKYVRLLLKIIFGWAQ